MVHFAYSGYRPIIFPLFLLLFAETKTNTAKMSIFLCFLPPSLSASKHMSENNKMKEKKNENTVNNLYQDASVDYGHAPETIALML